MAHRLRVSESHRELVLAFMEQHPEVAHNTAELQHGLTVTYKRRLWQHLADTLNAQGPVMKTTLQWQEWWRRQLHEARHDAAAVTEAQRCTGGGRAPGFRRRVLQVTGMGRTAVPRELDQPPQAAGTQKVATAPAYVYPFGHDVIAVILSRYSTLKFYFVF
ncbi:hypothetical protein HPB50_013802 [Hyalomma asiaticum]|uniref:Uncharacterized protein n=1 Tax=Hyalomma asiaticum TaxID=266040 RepID=A0ACB7SGR8_HYAAI|nr:hypothetical protein HPB50_013802 [Hyalomma asiaticum]